MTTFTRDSVSGASGNPVQPNPIRSGRVVTVRRALALAAIAAVLAAILGAAAAVLFTRTQVDDLDRQVSTLTARVAGLGSQIEVLTSDKAALTGQLSQARAEVAALTRQNTDLREQITGMSGPEPVVATVSYDAVTTAAKWFLPQDGAYFLIVDVTVANPDPQREAFFSTYDFRLKGPDATAYPILEQSPVASEPRFLSGVSDLPGGRIQVQSQQLAPSETVKGSLVFFVTKPVSEFTITYHGQTTALTP